MSPARKSSVEKPFTQEMPLERAQERLNDNGQDGSQQSRKMSAADGKQTRDAKRKRWEAKQASLEEQKSKDDVRETWMCNHADRCTKVELDDVERIKTARERASLSDAALEALLRPYVDLKDGPERLESSGDTLFIAEGTETVRLLIQQCSKDGALTVKSIFVKRATLFDLPVQLMTDVTKVSTESSRKRTMGEDLNESVQEMSAEQGRPPFHILVGTEEAMSAVAGFHISRGALACGVVPKRDEAWLNRFISQKDPSKGLRLLALDGISDSANMGSMIRCAAAFGVDAMILSHDCCDAWYRRSVRVSMGYIFHVPVVRVGDLPSILRGLASSSCVSYAAVIDRDADCVLEEMRRGEVPRSWCCIMGNEGNGISKTVLQACNHRLRIGMADGVDSLSVPIAAGILLHGLKEIEARDVE